MIIQSGLRFASFCFQEHEKTCQEDDDVIFCGEEFLADPLDEQSKEQATFLQNFSLVNPNLPLPNQMKSPIKKYIEQPSSGAKRRMPRCSQIVLSSNVPFSSPAGQQLLKLSKSHLARSYILEKLERTERYCCAPPLTGNNQNNWMKPIKYNRIPVTYRRPQEQTYRWYNFPRRQHRQHWHRQAFLNLNINEMKMCKPVTVKVAKLSLKDIETFNSQNRCEEVPTNDDGETSTTLNDQLPIVDVIDLCSDDDSDEGSSYVHGHYDNSSVSQTALTPASTISPSSFIEPLQTPFEMYTKVSTQSTMSMFNSDTNYYQHRDTHQSFLNGAQGSIVTQIDKLIELRDASIQSAETEEAHISIDLTL